MSHFQRIIKGKGTKTRETIILEQIKKNPTIHHNALKKIIVPKHMATKTFDLTIKSLVMRNLVEVIPMDDNKKHYSLAKTSFFYYKEPEKELRSRFVNLTQFTNSSMQVYHSFQAFQKVTIASRCIQYLFKEVNLLTIHTAVQESEYQELENSYKKLLAKIFNFILADKDKDIVFPLVLEEITGISEVRQTIENSKKIKQ